MEFKFPNMIFFIIFAGLIALYVLTMPFTEKHNRYTMYFVNMRTKQIGTEARYVVKNGNKKNEVQFVEELLLGPMNHDFYDYVKKDTKINACFVDGTTLYISLPESVLDDVQDKMTFKQFYDLFEKNVFKNFSHISNVCMFLDGKQVYASEELISDITQPDSRNE